MSIVAKKRWHVRRIAKASDEDILVQLTVCNRGSEGATLQVLPTVWLRNVWT